MPSSLQEFDEGVSPTSVAEGRLAASILHPSHRAYQKRGYIWCWKCGAWGSTNPGKLRKPCASVPSKPGKEVLARVRRGLTPKSGATWLLEEHEAPPEGLVLNFSYLQTGLGVLVSGLRNGTCSDLSLLCVLDPGSSPCLLHIAQFTCRRFGLRGCVFAGRSVARSRGLRLFLHDLVSSYGSG